MQIAGCEKCKMYGIGTYVQPSPLCTMGDAELVIIIDSPSKSDAKAGRYLTRESGDWLLEILREYVDVSKTYITSTVRCFAHKKNAKTLEAKRCYSQYLAADVEWMRWDKKPRRVMCIGFWPPKLLLGHDLKELHGHVVQDEHIRYGIIRNPTYYTTKYVKWSKDTYGNWVCPPGSQERAKAEFFQESQSVIHKLFSTSSSNIVVGATHTFPYTPVSSVEEMVKRLDEQAGKIVVTDVETAASDEAKAVGDTALDWFYGADRCIPRTVSFGFFNDYASIGYTPGSTDIGHDKNNLIVYTGPMHKAVAMRLMRTKNVMFNASYDSGVIYKHTDTLVPIYADPCDMGYVTDQSRKNYRLKSLVYTYVPEFATYADEMEKNKNYDTADIATLSNYNAGDVFMTAILFWKFAYIINQQGMDFLYWSIMGPVKEYLRDMEAYGVTVHKKNFGKVAHRVNKELEAAHQSLINEKVVSAFTQATGKPFNPKSQPSVLSILQAVYGEAVTKADKKMLENILRLQRLKGMQEDTFIKALVDYRKADKMRSTYVEGIGERTRKGIVYPAFKINTTETGRTSSGGGDAVGLGRTRQINIQNIPRASDLRAMFCSRAGMYLAYADYGQIEIRVAGACAKSTEIRDICLSGKDFHGMTTATAFKLDYDFVMQEDAAIKAAGGGTSFRTKGKTVAFGILYGMMAEALAEQLNLRLPDGKLDVEASQDLIDKYFIGMPSVKKFIDDTHEFVKRNLFVQTVFGRKRYFNNSFMASLREGVNTLVQSAASDIFLMALTCAGKEFKRLGMYGKYVFPWAEVHDAITWEVKDCVPRDEIQGIMHYCMTEKVRKDNPLVDEFLGEIPLVVDFKFDTIWH